MNGDLGGNIDKAKTAETLKNHFDLPVVFLRTHSGKQLPELDKETEAFDFILKPCRSRELYLGIEPALHKYRLEKRLGPREETLRQVVENIKAVFWVSSPGCRKIYYVSPGYEAIWGRSCRSLYQEPLSWLDHVVEEDRRRVRESIEKELSGRLESLARTEYRIVRPDGSLRWILARVFPITNLRNEVHRIAGIADDITERKLLEEDHRRIRNLETLGKLAGGLAHDFNNILQAILSNIQLAKLRSAEKKEICGNLENAERACFKAKMLTDQLLAFSGGDKPRKKVFSLAGEIENIVRFALSGANVKSRFSIGAGIRLVEADLNQLRLMINNLVLNSVQAMPEGGLLEVSVENASLKANEIYSLPEGRYVRVTIKDQGTGIPEDHLPHIFDPYFTTKNTPQKKGSGLGLTTVLSIIKKHGGYITVESTVGAGSIFTVYLPAFERDEDPPVQ